MKKILFVVHSLHRGGAENQLKHLISAINCDKEYEANLLVFTDKIFFDIKEFTGLRDFHVFNPLLRPVKFIRFCDQYDFIISFMFNASLVTSALLYLRRQKKHFLSVRVEKIPVKYFILWKLLCFEICENANLMSTVEHVRTHCIKHFLHAVIRRIRTLSISL